MVSTDAIISTAKTTGQSRAKMASTVSLPMPGMAKMTSMTTEPANTAGKTDPMSVMMGKTALRNACFQITRPSGRPLARAVRM